MKLSIVIPVFQSHEIVRRQALYFENLNLPAEIILMDDGSDPPIPQYDVFKVYQTGDKRPWTQPCAKNMGAEIATGEYLFFTDIDHILTKEAIEAALFFKGDKMHFRRTYAVLDENGKITQDLDVLFKYGLKRRKRKLRTYHHTNTFVMRRDVFLAMGGYDERLCEKGTHPTADDRHLYGKYRRFAKAGHVDPWVWGPEVHVFPYPAKSLFHRLER